MTNVVVVLQLLVRNDGTDRIIAMSRLKIIVERGVDVEPDMGIVEIYLMTTVACIDLG